VKSLRVLRCYNGSGGDEGQRALEGLAELENLTLENVGVTDAGLDALRAFPKLKKLVVKESKVTEAALASLGSARPELQVSR